MHIDIEHRLSALEERLGVEFKDRELLLEAVTHRSYLNEHPEFRRHNERLEFLGDAVLEIVVTEHLFRAFSDTEEGKMTNWRAALVNAERLASVAKTWQLDDVLLLSRGEAQDKDSKARMYIHANAFEAILGALYLDQGIGSCRLLVDTFLHSSLTKIIAESKDPKSELQEMLQERFGITPHYRVLQETGPDHKKNFRIGVFVGEQLIAQADGMSKQEAQVATAKVALATINDWEGRLLERGLSVRSNKCRSRNGDKQ